ncbi:MAG: hypothetical protein AB9897_03250 [Anaerolineaceae bacterium]
MANDKLIKFLICCNYGIEIKNSLPSRKRKLIKYPVDFGAFSGIAQSGGAAAFAWG